MTRLERLTKRVEAVRPLAGAELQASDFEQVDPVLWDLVVADHVDAFMAQELADNWSDRSDLLVDFAPAIQRVYAVQCLDAYVCNGGFRSALSKFGLTDLCDLAAEGMDAIGVPPLGEVIRDALTLYLAEDPSEDEPWIWPVSQSHDDGLTELDEAYFAAPEHEDMDVLLSQYVAATKDQFVT